MAVYTKVSEADLNAFLADYHVGKPRQLTGIEQGVENSNFYLETDRCRLILTLYEKRVCEGDLPFFISLMRHLDSKGLPTAGPVADKDGNYLGRLNDRPAALISFLDGEAKTELSPSDCAAGGAMLAHLQLATSDFDQTRENNLSITGWTELVRKCGDQADSCQAGLTNYIKAELVFLKNHWPDLTALPRGVVHVDLFPDNVLFTGREISGVIDFYFACTDFYAYDLAVSLNAWAFDAQHHFLPAHARAFLAAYEQIRPLAAAERAALSLFGRGAALRFLLTRLYDWLNQDPAALVSVKDPLEYLAKSRFHRETDITDIIDG